MSTSSITQRSLGQLLADNFVASRQCRKFAEAIADVSLKHYFQNLASRRSQFALELAEEISYYGGKQPHMPVSTYDRTRNDREPDENLSFLKRLTKLHKKSLLTYQNALCKIHDGSCREVLLRHKAFLETCIAELKSLKTLLESKEKLGASKEVSK